MLALCVQEPVVTAVGHSAAFFVNKYIQYSIYCRLGK